jgi:two-component system, LuxR family, response regulator FixJ
MDLAQRIMPKREIFVVDDDPTIHDVLSAALSHEGMRVVSFTDGSSFLAVAGTQLPSCVLLDVNMPDRSGLEVLREINAKKYPAPILMISGRRDVPAVVSAIKCGALDYIEKPLDADMVVDRVNEAIMVRYCGGNENGRMLGRQFFGHELLTPREGEVLAHISAGESNKEVGRSLGISTRTVEVHRAHIMEKFCAKNATDLMRIVLSNGHG